MTTKRKPGLKQRFRILPYTNASGTQSWRVTGICRDGLRIRENHADLPAAQHRQLELEAGYHGNDALLDPDVKFTRLSKEALAICEAQVARLNRIEDLPAAVTFWLDHGRNRTVEEAPLLDDAVDQYVAFLGTPDAGLRPATVANRRCRLRLFRSEMPNTSVAVIGPDDVRGWLQRRRDAGKSIGCLASDRKAVSAFFIWAMGKRYVTANPTAGLEGKKRGAAGNGHRPEILSIPECKALLRAAESVRDGALVPHVALSLFGAIRPAEVERMTWEHINLADREIVLPAAITKTGRQRSLEKVDVLFDWLRAYQDKDIVPKAFIELWVEVRQKAGFKVRGTPKNGKPWPSDVLRHTGISHLWRKTGSYGLTAQHAGNSEGIIRAYYQSMVTSEDTRRFYSIRPTKKGAAK